jgi:hypothetical protein
MRKILFLASLLFVFFSAARATHLRSGEIQVRQLSPDGLTVEVTIVVYTNTINTAVLFGGDQDRLDFGDGTSLLIPEQQNVLQPSLGSGVAMASYTIAHTYASQGAYLITYAEQNRNEGVLNMDESVNTMFYIETLITLKPGISYRTPDFLLPSIHHAVAGKPFSLSLSCVDSMGHQLFYETFTPKRAKNATVTNYTLPENFEINSFNGLITWDTKFNGAYTAGEYGFAVRVWQFDLEGVVIGYITRDFQVILEDGTSDGEIVDNVDLDENNRIYVPEDNTFELKVVATATETDNVMLSAYSELSEDVFQFTTYDSTTDEGISLKAAKLVVQNSNEIVRDLPYVITIRSRFESDGTVLANDLNYLFYTKDTELVMPEHPVTSTENEVSKAFFVYPNPTRDLIYFSEDANNLEFELWDTAGTIRQQGTAKPDTTADLHHLSPGLYLLVLKEKNKRSVVKIIRE